MLTLPTTQTVTIPQWALLKGKPYGTTLKAKLTIKDAHSVEEAVAAIEAPETLRSTLELEFSPNKAGDQEYPSCSNLKSSQLRIDKNG